VNDRSDELCSIDAGQEWEIDLFRPEDAPGVRNLFLSVYGEGYPIRTYLDPEKLIAENAAGRVISSVSRTMRGDIVGHNALYQSAPFKKLYESGAGLVHEKYRGGKGVFDRLIRHGIEVGAKKFDLDAIFGEAVCNHVFTQKATENLGFLPCAVEVDLMPATAYIKEKSASGRVAVLFGIIETKNILQTVYLPSVYEEPMLYLYSGLKEKRDIQPATVMINEEAVTQIDVEYFEFAQVSRTAVWRAGVDFEAVFALQEQELFKRGAEVMQIALNLSDPWIGSIAEILRKQGYFFCGILPRWLNADAMLMTKILHHPSWEDIHIYSERSKKILELVRNDWQFVMESAAPKAL
jgi:hypothetical protein